jgi:hypothetical protein
MGRAALAVLVAVAAGAVAVTSLWANAQYFDAEQ